MRAIADVLRTRILELLRERPMTVTQVAEVLKLAPAKVHYHVRELERVGLLHLVETREKGRDSRKVLSASGSPPSRTPGPAPFRANQRSADSNSELA